MMGPINLSKGQKINLSKRDGSSLTSVSLGMNWGAIKKHSGGILGFGGHEVLEAVDLDASCAVFDADKNLIEVISFRNLVSKNNGWIRHSGDDRVGDTDGDDGCDNETIAVDFSKSPANAAYVVFFLNSFRGQDFATVPYATIRIYEGVPRPIMNEQEQILAKYDIASDRLFAGYVSMVMGRMYRRGDEWKFASIGEPTRDRSLNETVQTVQAQLRAL